MANIFEVDPRDRLDIKVVRVNFNLSTPFDANPS